MRSRSEPKELPPLRDMFDHVSFCHGCMCAEFLIPQYIMVKLTRCEASSAMKLVNDKDTLPMIIVLV